MKATLGFAFFLLFLAGIALVNLRGNAPGATADLRAPTAEELSAQPFRLLAVRGGEASRPAGIELLFTRGGLLSISGACNAFTADYRLTDGALEVGEIAGTRRACDPQAMHYDTLLGAALADTARVVTDGRQVVLIAAGGERLARFAPAPAGDP